MLNESLTIFGTLGAGSPEWRELRKATTQARVKAELKTDTLIFLDTVRDTINFVIHNGV